MSSPFLSSADWYNHPTPTNNNSNVNRAATQSQPFAAPSSHSNLSNQIQRSSSPFSNSNNNNNNNNNNLSSSSGGSRVGTIGGHRSSSSSGPPSRQGSESPAPNATSTAAPPISNPTPISGGGAGSNSPFGLGLGSNSSTESFRQTMALNAFRNANTSSPMSQSSSSTNTKQPTAINTNLGGLGDGIGRKDSSIGETASNNGYVTAHSQVGSSSNDSTTTGGGAGFNNNRGNAFGSPYVAPYSPALSAGFGGFGSNQMASGGGSGSVYNTPRLGFDSEPIGSIGNGNGQIRDNSSKRLSASSNPYDSRFEPRKSNLGGGNTTSSSLEKDSSEITERHQHPLHPHQLNKTTLSNHEGSLNSASTGTTANNTQSPTSTAESFPTSNSGNGLLAKDGKDNLNATIIPRSNSSGSYPFPPSSNQTQQQRGNSTPLLNVPLANSSSSSTGGFGSLAGGLLSPTAATLGSTGPNTIIGPSSPSGLQSPSIGGGGWQSPTPFSLGSSATTNTAAAGGGGGNGSEIGTGSSNAFDALARSSPLVNDILDRLVRLETSVRDVNRQMAGVVRNVSLLIDRTRHLPQQNNLSGGVAPIKSPIPSQGSFPSQQQQRGPPLPLSQSQSNQRYSDMGSIQQGIQDVSMGTQNANDDVRMLSNQLSHLSSSVAQLISGGMNPAQQQQALAGLGLAGQQQQQQNQFGTPQLGGPRGDNRMASPMIPNNSSSFATHSPHLGPTGGFPQQGGAGNRLSWGAVPSGVGGGPGSVGGMNSPHLDGMPTTSSTRGLPKELADRRWSGRSVVGGGGERRESFGTPNLRTPDVDGPNASRFNDPQHGTTSSTTNSSGLITKWEGLPLHPDLLRSILKYGLGPPNKIQQRALPFLLRGNDIIAQAPPTQERIASYVIPALQLVLSTLREPNANQIGLGKGPIALIISTTVDQATQAQRMVLGLGASLGIRVHIAAAASIDASQEAIAVSQSQPHIIVGTPRKMSELFQHLQSLSNSGTTLALSPSGSSTGASTSSGPVEIKDVRLVVLDEADQLIARNLSDHVSTLLKLLPLPRSSGLNAIGGSGSISSPMLSPRLPPASIASGSESSTNQTSSSNNNNNNNATTMDRQTAIFSNTVPQDVLNFAQSIHLRESVRVLVRREGSVLPTSLTNPSGGNNNNTSHNGSAPIPISGSGGSSFLQTNQQRNGGGGDSNSLSTSQPSNALGSSPMNSNSAPISSDPILSSLKGLRQYYLYVAVSTPSSMNSPNPTSMMMNGSRMNHHETEMKLDVITDLLEDMEFGQLVIYTANANTTELVTYKLASRGIEALALHRDMAQQTRSQTISKFRSPNSTFPAGLGTPNLNGGPPTRGARKALVVHDLVLNPKEVHQIPLIVFYDLPRSVEEYKEKIACAASNGFSRPSVCVNVVTASGGPRGDIEMLRTLECHLGCKMAELPMDPKSILNF